MSDTQNPGDQTPDQPAPTPTEPPQVPAAPPAPPAAPVPPAVPADAQPTTQLYPPTAPQVPLPPQAPQQPYQQQAPQAPQAPQYPQAPGAAQPPAPPYPPQQPGYAGYPGSQQPLATQPKGLAISALIVGIVSLVLCWFPIIGILGGIAAVILGIIALKKAQSKGMSITGLITGGLAVIAAGIILIVSVMFFGALAAGGDQAVRDLEQLSEELESSVPSTTAEPATPETTEPEVTEEPADDSEVGEWVTVATLTGNADQQSDTLKLTGGKFRLSYDFTDSTGAGTIVGAIYLLPEGTDIMTDGGIPEVMASKPGAGESMLRKDDGEYFLKVMAANADYTVTLEAQK